MLGQVRRLLSDPVALARWAVENPRTVALLVAGVAVLTTLVVLSFGLGLVPKWVVLFGLAVPGAYVTTSYWRRTRLLLGASATDAGAVTPDQGTVRVSGEVSAAADGARVTHDGEDGEEEYLAYRYEVSRKERHSEQGATRRTITDEHRAVPLSVSDGAGSVVVDATTADLKLDWDRTERRGGKRHRLATLSPGDEVTAYGTALTPEERAPRTVGAAVTEGRNQIHGRDVESVLESEDVVVGQGPDVPTAIVTDRPRWRVVARSLGLFVLGVVATVGLLGLGLARALGVSPL